MRILGSRFGKPYRTLLGGESKINDCSDANAPMASQRVGRSQVF